MENKYFQIFLDFFRKRFLKAGYEEKSSFVAGIEVSELAPKSSSDGYGDYKKHEQITYTYNTYVGNILRKLSDNKKMKPILVEKICGYLRYYDRIGMLTLEELDG